MLRLDLIEAVNSERAWAFVGSGASAAAGLPTWAALLTSVMTHLKPNDAQSLTDDFTFTTARQAKDYPVCFSLIEGLMGRAFLEERVSDAVNSADDPGPIHRLIADWPFAGYITTNFDGLLLKALQVQRQPAWTVVGNSDQELKQLAGDVTGIVWHLHGSPRVPGRLVITEEDYSATYSDNSPIILHLKSLLLQRRVVFIGFGFRDHELMRLLRQLSGLANPARPWHALIAGITGTAHETERLRLLYHHNIDVIPYQNPGEDHEQLVETLETHGALILRRSVRYNRAALPCPTYDTEVTSLLTYNELVLKGALADANVPDQLTRARILTLASQHDGVDGTTLRADVESRAIAIGVRTAADLVDAQLHRLIDDGLLSAVEVTAGPVYRLSTEARDLMASHAGKAALLARQFRDALQERATRLSPEPGSVGRIAVAAESFLLDSIEKRALVGDHG